jgi:hypothetical protein
MPRGGPSFITLALRSSQECAPAGPNSAGSQTLQCKGMPASPPLMTSLPFMFHFPEVSRDPTKRSLGTIDHPTTAVLEPRHLSHSCKAMTSNSILQLCSMAPASSTDRADCVASPLHGSSPSGPHATLGIREPQHSGPLAGHPANRPGVGHPLRALPSSCHMVWQDDNRCSRMHGWSVSRPW